MTKLNKFLKIISVILGLVSAAFFIYDNFVFADLRPKMIVFEAISPAEEYLLYGVGVGLLLFLAFCLLSLLRITRFLKSAQKITPFSIILVVSGVLSLLFVFADVALLNDITKQYRHGLSQPEWALVYPIMGFQFITAVVFTYLHAFGFKEDQVEHVARDSNVFLIAQYVGVICGSMGLASSSLGFLFPKAWSLQIHTTTSLIILLLPYGLIVLYWLIIKLQEENRQWYDEKQLQDVGQSAFLTLVLSVIFMAAVFVANYNNLGGIVSILWLPLYTFFVLFLFSLGNLYFGGRN